MQYYNKVSYNISFWWSRTYYRLDDTNNCHAMLRETVNGIYPMGNKSFNERWGWEWCVCTRLCSISFGHLENAFLPDVLHINLSMVVPHHVFL